MLAVYLGPNRTRTETVEVCKIVLLQCMYVEGRGWKYHVVEDWVCANEGKPWLAYPDYGPECWEGTAGSRYWEKRFVAETRTVTYPEATIEGDLQGCELRNGWCVSPSSLSLTAQEPLSGYGIEAIEGTRNGETFACRPQQAVSPLSCQVLLEQGENVFTFWAISSWGDSSRMGTLTARVDTRPPQVSGSLSGAAGENGWYVSAVTVSASASDPEPGSGIEALTYLLNGGSETPYTAPVTLEDGVHTITVRARDRAGHVGEASVDVRVDTRAPQVGGALTGEQANGWYLSQVTFTASAGDDGSGLERVEYALDGGAWREYTAPVTIGDGEHVLRLRAFDLAGNVAEGAPLVFRVDGTPPRIQLPSAWYVWESGSLRVSDGQSGLSGVEVEIRDPQGRWPKVGWAYEAQGDAFSREIVWDRRFGDGTLAPPGTYTVVVKAFDRAGNMARTTASVIIPLPNVTPSPLPSAASTESLSESALASTPTLVGVLLPTATPTPTRPPVVLTFGNPSPVEMAARAPEPETGNGVLWGGAALAVAAAATAAAVAAARRRKEQEEAQARAVRAAVEAKNAAEQARRERLREMLKIRNWLMGQALRRQAQNDDQPSPPAMYQRKPPFADPETADVSEAERRREYMASAAYQERQKKWAAEAYARFRAREREGYNAAASEQLMCTIDDTPLQEKKSIWQRIGDWMRSPSTWWGFTTEDEAVELMKRARGLPDISIPLPILKGFGMDDVAGPLKYTVKTDTVIRAFGRMLGDFSVGALAGIGLGITIAPNLIKNVREKSPWHQTAADLIIDTVGFGVSELAGWGVGLVAGWITAALGAPMAAPYVALAAKVVVDGGVSILWDSVVEKYGLRDWLNRQMEKGSQSILQK